MCKESHTKIKEAVARGWYYPKTQRKIMDADLAEAISLEVDALFHDLQDENERLKNETYPNPLCVELKDGSVVICSFKDDDGAGVMFRDSGEPHKIGEKAGEADDCHQPQKGEVYIKCYNIESFQVFKDYVLEAEQALKDK